MTAGPWKPISLDTYHNRITEVDVRSDVSPKLDVQASVGIELLEKASGFASVTVQDPNGATIAREDDISTSSGHSHISFSFRQGEVDLWYPVGYGKQPLYTVEVVIKDEVPETQADSRFELTLKPAERYCTR